MYLLLVDNNYLSSRDLKGLFDINSIKCEVVETSSSRSLLDLAQKLKPEFIVVDFEFFSVDPVATINTLRQYNPDAYIIAFADQEFYTDLSRAIEAGVDDYLIKPLQREDVLLRIRIGLHHLQAASAETGKVAHQQQAYQKNEQKVRAIMGDRVDLGSAPAPELYPPVSPGKVSYIGQAREKFSLKEAVSEHFEIREADQVDHNSGMISDSDPIDHFEQLVTDAKLMAKDKPSEAITLLDQALELYKSEYLQDYFSSGRRSLIGFGQHELYIGAVLDLADLLINNQEAGRATKLCEEAMQIDYFDEGLHIRVIEALLARGEYKRALAHYDQAASAFYKVMGLTPSAEMKKVYEKIQKQSDNLEIDLTAIQVGLNGKELPEGALCCDPEQFRLFYKLEQLRGERSGQSVLLCMLVLISKDYSKPPVNLLQEVMQNLLSVVTQTLRKGDLFTKWHEGQLLLLLPGLNREQAAEVLDRIEYAYNLEHSLQGLVLQKRIETILPLEGDSHFN